MESVASVLRNVAIRFSVFGADTGITDCALGCLFQKFAKSQRAHGDVGVANLPLLVGFLARVSSNAMWMKI